LPEAVAMPKILSVALENHPGSLADILELLASQKFNVEAVEAEAQGDFGSARLLVSDSPKAVKLLKSKGFDVIEAEAIELRLDDSPGQLAKSMRALAEAGVNVVSLFGTTPPQGDSGRLLLRVNNPDAAKKALKL